MSAREPRTIRLAEDRWATIRHVVEAIAIVAAGIWAFYVFVYQERIKPASEPAAIAPSIKIERIGRDARRDVLRVSVTIRNTGKTEIDLAASGFNVWGDRYGARETTASESRPNFRRTVNAVPKASEKLVATVAQLLDPAEGGIGGRHLLIQPGAENVQSLVLVVPRGAYDVVRAQVMAMPLKTPVTERVRVTIVRQHDGSSWLDAATPGLLEYDTSSQTALIP